MASPDEGVGGRAPSRFVAVGLPPDVREVVGRGVERVRAAAPTLRFTPAEGWHVTLAFLGPLADPVPAVEALRTVARELAPFDVEVAGAGRFGERVLWVGVEDPDGGLATSAARVVDALVRAEVAVLDADRPFRPHVTVARAGRRRVRAVDVGHLEVVTTSWRVAHLALWSSVGGGRYVEDASVPLGEVG